ncbi:MAG TPA: pseudouridine synthase [Myxococcota bacterium]
MKPPRRGKPRPRAESARGGPRTRDEAPRPARARTRGGAIGRAGAEPRPAEAPRPARAERLQKLIANAGLASRRAAEEWILAGRVTLNGRPAELGERADLVADDVRVDGKRLVAEARDYWLLNKPAGVITTLGDPHSGDRRTVHDLMPAEARGARLFPVGRLDVGSEGLVLMTNDGELAHALLHPSREVDKEYRVRVRGKIEARTLERLRGGIELDDGPMRPAHVSAAQYDAARDESELVLILREGRKREIRRAMDALGHRVVRLVRERMGPLLLARLPSGAARRLGPREVSELIAFAAARAQATGRGTRSPAEANPPAREKSHKPIGSH